MFYPFISMISVLESSKLAKHLELLSYEVLLVTSWFGWPSLQKNGCWVRKTPCTMAGDRRSIPHFETIRYMITSPSGWWYTYPSEKWWTSSVGMMTFPTEWKNINVPNHQPAIFPSELARDISWMLHVKKYFTSNDPHHDIYTFSYWQIFWHSIWHIFWHSTWHIFWHSIWHIFWQSIWHIFWQIFWHSIWQIFWHSIWHIFWHFFWHSIWHIFWHSIWHIFWHSFWHIFWHSVWHSFLHSFWHSIWHIFWHSIWHLLWHSSRWGPAVPTAIWKSRLRSGSAHCNLEVAVEVRQCPLGSGARGWGPAVPTGICNSRLRSGSAHMGSGARGGGPAVPTGIWRRRRVRRRRRRTALIKSNNPYVAGGEQAVPAQKGMSNFSTPPKKMDGSIDTSNSFTVYTTIIWRFLKVGLPLVIIHF